MGFCKRESSREELLSYLDKLQARLSEAERDLKFLSRKMADAALQAENERLREALADSVRFMDLRECLGEAFHTAFRKGSDTSEAWHVWKAIQSMDHDDWGRCLDWAWETIRCTYNGLSALDGDE
jgi:hypothetical protein